MTQAQNLSNWSQQFSDWSNPLANRNGFVDGAFDFWLNDSQNVGTAGGYVNAIMWQIYAGVGGTMSSNRADNRVYGIGESNSQNYCVLNQTVASTGTPGSTSPYIAQRIEGVNKYAGKSVTLSFKIWLGSGTITIPMVLCRQNFGTGGSPSAQVSADKAISWVLTTTPQRYSVRIDIPAINSKTLGNNGDDNLMVGLWFPPGVTFNLGIMEAQIETSSPNSSGDTTGKGGSPTAFEYRGRGPEQQRVLRYYESGYVPPAYYNMFNGIYYIAYIFNQSLTVPKRANPTVTLSNMNYYSGGNPTVMPPANIQVLSPSPINFGIYYTGGMTNCVGCAGGNFVADARL